MSDDVKYILDERTGVIEIVDLQKAQPRSYIDDCEADRRNAECYSYYLTRY